MPAGRPTKYKPEFCDLIIGIGAKGGWLAEMAEACDVARSTMDEWAANHPEFSEALTRAKQKAQVWFEEQGREGLAKGSGFNAKLWQVQMQARHREEYTERKEIKDVTPPDAPVVQSNKELARALAAILAKGVNAGD